VKRVCGIKFMQYFVAIQYFPTVKLKYYFYASYKITLPNMLVSDLETVTTAVTYDPLDSTR